VKQQALFKLLGEDYVRIHFPHHKYNPKLLDKSTPGKHWQLRQCDLRPGPETIRDRCYDFLNIFAEKFCKKIGVF
jgi:hypothetical protein